MHRWIRYSGLAAGICLFLAIAFSFSALASGSLLWFGAALLALASGIWFLKVKMSAPSDIHKTVMHTEYNRTHEKEKNKDENRKDKTRGEKKG